MADGRRAEHAESDRGPGCELLQFFPPIITEKFLFGSRRQHRGFFVRRPRRLPNDPRRVPKADRCDLEVEVSALLYIERAKDGMSIRNAIEDTSALRTTAPTDS